MQLTAILALAALAVADLSDLEGTWSSKSQAVMTGPGFYDPVDELLIEPALPGISYSFTKDGYWEEAIYQVTPNPQNHSCPAAVLIYQHGSYTEKNGQLTLSPFQVDGRQLLSEPCKDNGVSSYTRYNQQEVFKGYNVYIDPYHGRWRLDLIKSDGAIMQPLYLAYRPPQMLPTETMNPVASTGNVKRDSLPQLVKRGLQNRAKTNAVKQHSFDAQWWLYSSLGLMAVGGVMFYTSL